MRKGLRLAVFCAALLPMGCGPANLRSEPQPSRAAVPAVTRPAAPNPAGFDRWVENFRPRALRQGISAATLDRAFANVWYDPEIVARDRRQAEFTRPIWDYLDSAVSDARIRTGREMLSRHAGTLRRIEARYGVPPEVVIAVWGMETNYGSFRGRTPIIPALATLAYDGRRGAFFEEQLIAALKIIQAGDISPEGMLGSWAGAMGHTQFMPTSYLAYAVDFTGDGRRDIWSDDPTDALASAANYLSRFGWKPGQPWGVEVVLPQGFNYGLAGKNTRRGTADWIAMGVRAADGARIPDHGPASILLPAGASGVAFMIFDNFRVISRYNNADSYVIGLGHLSDRLRGAGPFRTAWPRTDRPLTDGERREIQQRLAQAGFYSGEIDGLIGGGTMDAIRAWQTSIGIKPDGWATEAVLNRLRQG
ncbi:MAG: lytic murein transglycosylase [Gemmobacter sp.]